MHIPKKITNIGLGTLVILSTMGAIVKTSDYFSKKIDKNFKTHYTTADILALQDTTQQSLVHNKLLHTLSETRQNDINTAIKEYIEYSLPKSDYAIDPWLYTRLVENRIYNNVFPGNVFPTGLEEYSINVKKEHGDALCASAIRAKLRMFNIRSEEMRKFFAKQGKHTRFAEQLLSQHGRKSTINEFDSTEYYDQTTTENLHPHYNNVLNNLHNSKAGNIITARYASSRSLQLARHEDQNATHSILSLWTITQHLTWSQLWIEQWTQEYIDFIKSDESEKKVIIAYQLLKTRAIKENMIGEETQQKNRIRMLLSNYPDLLSIGITIEWADIKINIKGPMWEHVYPINWQPTNYIHYLFELIAYNWWNLNNDGSVFLLCNEFTSTNNALKKDIYNWASPLYKHIEQIRKKTIQSEMILKTYIVSFDDIDQNRDKKINNKIINGNKDKTIAEVLEEMTEVCYNSSQSITKLNKEHTKEYLKKYLHILWAIDRFPTGTILPMPYLTEDNRKIIDELYPQYVQYNDKLEHTSQKKYENHIIDKLSTTSFNSLLHQPVVVYPVCSWDDEVSITQQICKYIDKMVQHQPNMGDKKIKLGNLSREEYNRIFQIIQSDMIFPESYPKQALRTNQKVYINLPQVIESINTHYYPTKIQLSHNYIPPVISKELEKFEEIYDILEINESTRNIQKHNIIAETWWDISIFDISKIQRSRTKMIMEYTDFDDNNFLSKIKNINSEWPLQIRLDYYLVARNDVELIIQSAQHIVEKTKELWIDESQHKKLDEIITAWIKLQKEISILERQKIKTSKEFEKQKGELKHILSDIINLTGNSLDNPKSDLWTLLSIQISAYTIERYLWRYSDKLQESIWDKPLTKEEISFIQHFTVIAHHLWQQDADQVFKIYMSIHLMRSAKEMGIISKEDNIKFQDICKQLNKIRKKDDIIGDTYNPRWYKDRYTMIQNGIWAQWDHYINKIVAYLKPWNNMTIPHYDEIRDKEIDNTKQYISTNIFDANAGKEFSLYLTTIPPNSDGLSSIFLSLIALIWWIWLYKVNKKKST